MEANQRRHMPSAAAVLLAYVATDGGVVDAGSVEVTAQMIAAGGGRSTSTDACRRLEATLGEAVIKRASGVAFVVTA